MPVKKEPLNLTTPTCISWKGMNPSRAGRWIARWKHWRNLQPPFSVLFAAAPPDHTPATSPTTARGSATATTSSWSWRRRSGMSRFRWWRLARPRMGATIFHCFHGALQCLAKWEEASTNHIYLRCWTTIYVVAVALASSIRYVEGWGLVGKLDDGAWEWIFPGLAVRCLFGKPMKIDVRK